MRTFWVHFMFWGDHKNLKTVNSRRRHKHLRNFWKLTKEAWEFSVQWEIESNYAAHESQNQRDMPYINPWCFATTFPPNRLTKSNFIFLSNFLFLLSPLWSRWKLSVGMGLGGYVVIMCPNVHNHWMDEPFERIVSRRIHGSLWEVSRSLLCCWIFM